ncbi:MAG: S-adenosylmethionine hydrolase [Candidatus Azotimanducaceae bacterium]
MKLKITLLMMCATLISLEALTAVGQNHGKLNALVLQSDFGNKDAAVPSMKGVAVGVSPDIGIYDLTHEIPVFDIWEASLRLDQTAPYWPKGTVFVSVVDPGVGTTRKSVVLKTKTGHFFVTPDNGSLTAVAENLGIDAVREIDEAVNRRKNSEKAYTFHGRDVYAYTGARLAAGIISFEQVGPKLPSQVLSIPYVQASFKAGKIYGNIPILDIQFGNIWTNIDRQVFEKLNLTPGDRVDVTITHGEKLIKRHTIPYYRSFGSAAKGEPLLYLNSVNDVSLAINQGSYARNFGISSGSDWSIEISPHN